MGKTQSKRSVDITTEPKKGPEEEVTGKLEKIEDIDQKQVNGDAATPQENNADAAEKKDPDESENDKDLTTEKSAEAAQSVTSAENTTTNGDQNITATAATAAADSNTKDEAAAKEGAPPAAEEISPLADESNKKAKKEKVKKKWSFRSISFGKKDKQKPAKTEETTNAENAAAATNGEAAAVEKTAAAAAGDGVVEPLKDEGAGGDTSEAVKVVAENGDATEKELNGQKTPTPTEEKTSEEVVANNESNPTAAVNSAESVPAAVSNETANETQTEKKVAETVNAMAALVSNFTEEVKEMKAEVSAVLEDVSEAVVEKIKTIPSVPSDGSDGDKTPHQNGTDTTENGQIDDVDVEQTNKSQIEVKTNITNTDNTSAANLATSTTTTTTTTTTSNSQSSSFTTTVELILPAQDVAADEASNAATAQDNTSAIVAAAELSNAASVNAVAEAQPAEDVAAPESTAAPPSATIVTEGVQQAGADGDSQPPPPLPISPPPSQVSVFAFKDNNQVTEEIPAASALVPADETAQPELAAAKEEENVIVDTAEPPRSPTAAIIAKHIAAKSDEFIAATEVVDEITEKAVEILLQQKQHEEPQAEPQAPSLELAQTTAGEQTEEEEAENTEHAPRATTPVVLETEDEPNIEIPPSSTDDDENIATTHVKNEIEIDDQMVVELINTVVKDANGAAINDTPTDIISQVAEISKSVAQAIVGEHEQHEHVAAGENENGEEEEEEEDCSLNVVKEIEKLTLNDIDDAAKLSDISPTKEIANVKDLKENAAAAAEITTQDLPVTCE